MAASVSGDGPYICSSYALKHDTLRMRDSTSFLVYIVCAETQFIVLHLINGALHYGSKFKCYVVIQCILTQNHNCTIYRKMQMLNNK